MSLVLSPSFPGPLETVFPKSARDFVFFPCLYILLLILLFCLFNVFSELFSLEFVEVFRTGKNLAGDCCFNSCDLAKQTLVNGVFLTNLEINLVWKYICINKILRRVRFLSKLLHPKFGLHFCSSYGIWKACPRPRSHSEGSMWRVVLVSWCRCSVRPCGVDVL